MGGECHTILRTGGSEEMYGRLRILSKVAYLFEQCRSWEKARAAYFAIISSIDEGEATWTSSFGHCDIMCPPVGVMGNDPDSTKVPKVPVSQTSTQRLLLS